MRLLLVLLVLTSFSAHAQDCASLLENAQPNVTFESIEQTISSTVYSGEQSNTVDIYQVIDITGERIYQETTLPGMGDITLRFIDGAATMQMAGMDMQMPVPPQLQSQLEQSLSGAFDAQGMLPSNYDIVSCDGQQTYAGLVTGEQITVNTNLPEAAGGATEMRFLFGEDGQLAGSLMDLPQLGQTLSVFETYELNSDNVPTTIRFKMYQLGDTPELFTETSITTNSYNEEVDESLFSP